MQNRKFVSSTATTIASTPLAASGFTGASLFNAESRKVNDAMCHSKTNVSTSPPLASLSHDSDNLTLRQLLVKQNSLFGKQQFN